MATEVSPGTVPVAARLRVRRLRSERVALAGNVVGMLALLGLIAGCAVVAVAAEQHHTFLSPSIHQKAPPGWLTWPFHGLWSNLTTNRHWIQNALDAVMLGMLA